jgi:hypothetical protein
VQRCQLNNTIYNVTSAGEKSRGDTLAVSPTLADFSVLRPLEFAKNIYILIMQRIIRVFINKEIGALTANFGPKFTYCSHSVNKVDITVLLLLAIS